MDELGSPPGLSWVHLYICGQRWIPWETLLPLVELSHVSVGWLAVDWSRLASAGTISLLVMLHLPGGYPRLVLYGSGRGLRETEVGMASWGQDLELELCSFHCILLAKASHKGQPEIRD